MSKSNLTLNRVLFHGSTCTGISLILTYLYLYGGKKYIKPVEDLVSYLDDNFKNNSNNRVKQLLGLNYEYPKIMDVSKKANNIGIGYRGKSN